MGMESFNQPQAPIESEEDQKREEMLEKGQISHEDFVKAHQRALEEADAAVKEREDAIASYQEGLVKAREKLAVVKEEIQEIGRKVSEIQGTPEERQKTYNEMNQLREILQRVTEANAEEEVRAYEKNIAEAEIELAKKKERRAMFES